MLDRRSAQTMRDLLGAHREALDLMQVGAYVTGSEPRVDAAIKMASRRDLSMNPNTKLL